MAICHVCNNTFWCFEDSTRRTYDETIPECTGICRCKQCRKENKQPEPYRKEVKTLQ